MSTKTIFWLKYCSIAVVLGIAVGLLGYQNMKISPFETLSDNLQVEEAQKLSFVMQKN